MLKYLVQDMLDIYLIKNGKFKKDEKTVDIVKSIKSLLDMFRVQSDQKNIQLLFNCSNNVPPIITTDE